MPVKLIAAPYTPMHDDGSLHLEMVATQARHLAACGVRGVFVAGSTGEGPSLSAGERRALAETWSVEGRRARLEVMIHVGHTCQRDAIELARHAGGLDVDGVATLAPFYFKPATAAELVAFCQPIAAAAAGVPFYFYDIPGMTGVRVSMPEFLERGSSAIPNLAGIKYSNNDLVQLQECVQFDGRRFEILFGCDEALLAGVALGVAGAVGSTYNFAAPLYTRLIDAWEDGDESEAQRLQFDAVRMVRLFEQYGFLPASKAAMELVGVPCGPPRPPLPQLAPSQREELFARLAEMNVLADAAAPPLGSRADASSDS